MMTLTGLWFLIFLPVCITLYYLIPNRFRYIWLLFCSYYFYISQSTGFTTLLVFSTIVTWLFGNLIYKANTRSVKLFFVFSGLILNIIPLILFKYGNFILSLSGSKERISLILPIGISFYTFQSLTYVFDCYRGDVKPEHNIFKYALFVSFFPLILSGPIERAKNLLPKLSGESKFDTDSAKDGLKLMLFGYFVKIVIVSRLTILTDAVFADYLNRSGFAILTACIAYSIQIYADFLSYSNIASGMCKIMGIDIIRNFRQPYFAESVADFWRRWHISLTSWFRDYLYIPLGGNRKGKLRKYINIMVVFLVSGLWHGANLTFVFWGGLNGLYQILGELLKPVRNKVLKLCKLDDSSGTEDGNSTDNGRHRRLHYGIQVFITYVLICFTWVFFRAGSIFEAFDILKNMFARLSYVNLFDGTLFTLGLGVKNMLFVILAIAILIISDVLCEKKSCDVSGLLTKSPVYVRWGMYYVLIIMMLLSMNLNMTEFIYAGF